MTDRFRSTQDRVNFTIIANARRLLLHVHPLWQNWKIVSELFGIDKPTACTLCLQCEINPFSVLAMRVPVVPSGSSAV